MGLDMYLYKKTYIGNEYAKGKDQLTIGNPGQYGGDIQTKRISEIIEQVGYWRKANAIHAWFVGNVQDGEDGCQESPVAMEQLKELRALCQEVLDKALTKGGLVGVGTRFTPNGGKEAMTEPGLVVTNPEVCEELLPCQSGFFFGNTDYDQFYLDDLTETVKIIDSLDEDSYYYYHASW